MRRRWRSCARVTSSTAQGASGNPGCAPGNLAMSWASSGAQRLRCRPAKSAGSTTCSHGRPSACRYEGAAYAPPAMAIPWPLGARHAPRGHDRVSIQISDTRFPVNTRYWRRPRRRHDAPDGARELTDPDTLRSCSVGRSDHLPRTVPVHLQLQTSAETGRRSAPGAADAAVPDRQVLAAAVSETVYG